MADTNEAFVIFKPESYKKDRKLYKEVLRRLRIKFDIKAMWPKKATAEQLQTFQLDKSYNNQRFFCAIVKSKTNVRSLDLIKEVIGRVADPKKCMLGSIRRDLGDLLLYSENVKDVADHISIWRPIFLKPKSKDGYGERDGYGDGYEE